MSKTYSLLCALGLCLLLVGVSAAQAPYVVHFYMTDGAYSDTLAAGTAAGAQYCLGTADSALGENELPPEGPSDVFDCRFTDIDNFSCKGQGVAVDLRPLSAGYYGTQQYHLHVHAGGNATNPGHVTMTWTDSLATKDGGYWDLADYNTGLSVANLATTSPATGVVLPSGEYTLTHGDATTFLTFDYTRLYSTDHNLKPKAQSVNKPGGKSGAKATVPNIFNLGTFAFKAVKGASFNVGSDAIHSVHMKAWSGVTKSSANKLLHWTPTSAGPYTSRCIDSISIPKVGKQMKYVKKQLTGLTPGKDQVDNWLFAQLMTLHMTDFLYQYGMVVPGNANTPNTGALDAHALENLMITSGPNAGQTVAQVMAAADAAIGCSNDVVATTEATFDEMAANLQSINDAFTMSNQYADNAQDTAMLADTVGVWNSGKGKTVTVTGNTAVAAQSLLAHPIAGLSSPHVGKSMIENASKPEHFSLDQNYPNPFNPTTEIRFSLSARALVTLKVYNILGQEVTTLANNEEFGASEQTVTFNANAFASGTYFYTLRVNDLKTGALKFTDVKKMVLIK